MFLFRKKPVTKTIIFNTPRTPIIGKFSRSLFDIEKLMYLHNVDCPDNIDARSGEIEHKTFCDGRIRKFIESPLYVERNNASILTKEEYQNLSPRKSKGYFQRYYSEWGGGGFNMISPCNPISVNVYEVHIQTSAGAKKKIYGGYSTAIVFVSGSLGEHCRIRDYFHSIMLDGTFLVSKQIGRLPFYGRFEDWLEYTERSRGTHGIMVYAPSRAYIERRDTEEAALAY
jgi:hypothetical protein